MLRTFALMLGCLLVGGCAELAPVGSLISTPRSGSPPLQVHDQTIVKLEEGNFALVRTNVMGRSKGFSLLGFITIYPATLGKAVNRLYGAAQLRPGEPQFVANLIIEHSSSFWILFGIPRTEVHADIVEFRPAPPASVRGKPK